MTDLVERLKRALPAHDYPGSVTLPERTVNEAIQEIERLRARLDGRKVEIKLAFGSAELINARLQDMILEAQALQNYLARAR